MAVNVKAEVPQDLRAKAVAQADILESDHAFLPRTPTGLIRAAGQDSNTRTQFNTARPCTGARARLVSNSLTNRRLSLPKIGSDSPMLIVCPNCATSYDVDVASLRPAGREVRCLRCQGIWRAELPHAEKLLAAANALAPVRRAIEAVAEAVAEEAAMAVEAGSIGGGMAGNMAGSMAGDEAGEEGGPFPEIACERAIGNIAADAACTQADHPIFTPQDGEHLGALWPITPADVTAELSLGRFGNERIEAEHKKITDGLDVERAIAAQDEAAGAELVVGITTIVERRARRQRRERWRLPLPRRQLAILTLLVADAAIIGWRADLVRAMPQTASFFAQLGLPVNSRGVDFAGVAATAEEHDGAPGLVVSGTVTNSTGTTEKVPRLRFAIRNAARQEIYSWTLAPERTTLPAGEKLAFRSRIPSPPADTREVLVSFADRADLGR
jgi:predicted Zn finger-like uncharacterized protein